jgi:hypothetical protein
MKDSTILEGAYSKNKPSIEVEGLLTDLSKSWEDVTIPKMDKCADCLYPEDVDLGDRGYCFCWEELIDGRCPHEDSHPPVCNICGRRHT